MTKLNYYLLWCLGFVMGLFVSKEVIPRLPPLKQANDLKLTPHLEPVKRRVIVKEYEHEVPMEVPGFRWKLVLFGDDIIYTFKLVEK